MNVVENSYYDHQEYGLVKVVKVEEGTVFMRGEENMGSVRQPFSDFSSDAEPADFRVRMDVAELNLMGCEQ